LLKISDLQYLCQDKSIAITKHANTRLKERGIELDDIKCAIKSGEIIRQYENDSPFPSCLILGLSKSGQHLHVVASTDGEFLYIITAYLPDKNEWETNLKSKRSIET